MDKVMSLSVNIVKIGLDLILKNFTTVLEVKNNGAGQGRATLIFVAFFGRSYYFVQVGLYRTS